MGMLVLILLLLACIFPLAQAAIAYDPFSVKVNGPLYPLDAYGMRGRYTGRWSNDTGQGLSYQLWMLSYDAATSKSFFLALIAIRNPRRPWDLTLPVVLWKAEQSRLVGDNTTLTFGTDGVLKLDEDGEVVWSTNTANRGVRWLGISNSATVMLLNENRSVALWQSSDEPSDTVLLQRALRPGIKLVSWNSSADPRDGLYSLEMGRNRMMLLYDSQPYWSFEGRSTEEESFAVFCYSEDALVSLQLRRNVSQINAAGLVETEDCSSPGPTDQVMRLPVNGSGFTNSTFLRIAPDGDVVLYSWNLTGTNWITYFNLSSLFKCFLPLSCGRYGTCNMTTGACEETCPESFIRRDQNCEPPVLALTTCSAEMEYHFVRQERSDYFFTNYTNPAFVASEAECQGRCESDCNCTAAFYNADGSCFLTRGEVQSLRTGRYVALLKVGRRRSVTRKQVQAITLGILVPALVLIILCLGWQCYRRRNKHTVDDEGEEESALQLSLIPGMPRRYTYEELQLVTKDFTDVLGTGGFGSVFRGQLGDGTEVAVKKLEGSNQKSKDFFAEVGILARTHHWNLVKLLGFCAQGPRKRLLVYEYMGNGSLDQWIFEDGKSQGKLSWKTRFNIALGTARGLSYLHNECAERIIHLDLKPENVLVNSAFEPKIADFGLSKLMGREESHLQLTIMRGTPGYVAPECLQEGTVTEKSDVFSFGVLLLEITSGCKNRSLSSGYLKENLLNSGRIDRVAALHLQEDVIQKRRLQTVAALCIQDEPDSRPSMAKVVQMMEGVSELPLAPPASHTQFFLAGRSKHDRLITVSMSDSTTSRSGKSFNKLLQENSSGSFSAFPRDKLTGR